MNVNFYTFSKRRNSTKQPTGTGTVIDCKLKEGTSVKNPKLTISGDVFGYDYAYIGDFGRYYFVSDVISEAKGITTYVLEEDSLASNKTAIGSTVARIAFASTGYNKEIIDTRLCAEVEKTMILSSSSANTFYDPDGCYIITAFGKSAQTSNGLGTSYALTLGNISQIHDWLGESTVMEKLTNYFLGNPLDSIFGCIWVPFDLDQVPGSSTGDIRIGNQSSQADGKLITGFVLNGTGIKYNSGQTLSITRSFNDFRDYEPYTTAQLQLPGVGLVDINLSDFYGSSNVKVQTAVEYGTGDIMYRIMDDNNKLKQVITTNVASLCPLGQSTSNIGGAIGSVASVAGGFGGLVLSTLTENPMGMLASGGAMLMGAGQAALNLNRHGTSIKGGSGGRVASIDGAIRLYQYMAVTEDCDNANYIAKKGRPVGVTSAISNYSGFIQCDDASVSIGGESWERDQINSYLNSGFFYE